MDGQWWRRNSNGGDEASYGINNGGEEEEIRTEEAGRRGADHHLLSPFRFRFFCSSDYFNLLLSPHLNLSLPHLPRRIAHGLSLAPWLSLSAATRFIASPGRPTNRLRAREGGVWGRGTRQKPGRWDFRSWFRRKAPPVCWSLLCSWWMRISLPGLSSSFPRFDDFRFLFLFELLVDWRLGSPNGGGRCCLLVGKKDALLRS